MTVHILVEGPSERAFFEVWGKRFLQGQNLRVHCHQGKGKLPSDLNAKPEAHNRALLHQLPAKLRALSRSVDQSQDSVLVLFDADDDNWHQVASTVEKAAKTVAPDLRVGVSVAVEETEAFYLGDLRALESAFPEADMKLARKYEPDGIVGTWELFGKVVRDGGGNKVAWAERMGPKLTTNPGKSRSPSFQKLCSKLESLVSATPEAAQKAKKYRHIARTDPSRRS